jgi:hypothetical protein
VNNLNLEPQSMNSGIERAALMISEEKHQQDSRKKKTIHNKFIYQFQSLLFSFVSVFLPKPYLIGDFISVDFFSLLYEIVF